MRPKRKKGVNKRAMLLGQPKVDPAPVQNSYNFQKVDTSGYAGDPLGELPREERPPPPDRAELEWQGQQPPQSMAPQPMVGGPPSSAWTPQSTARDMDIRAVGQMPGWPRPSLP